MCGVVAPMLPLPLLLGSRAVANAATREPSSADRGNRPAAGEPEKDEAERAREPADWAEGSGEHADRRTAGTCVAATVGCALPSEERCRGKFFVYVCE